MGKSSNRADGKRAKGKNKKKETFKKYGVDEINKFIQLEKEMGAVVSFSEGEASGEISKMFDKSIFEEK